VVFEARVAIVEAYEFSSTVHAIQVCTGNLALAVAYRTSGKDHGIVVLLQLVDGDIATNVYVSQQANLLGIEHTVEGLDDAFNARMVRCYTVSDEAEGCGHLLYEVNLYLAAGLFYLDIGGVDAGRPGANDGYFQGLIHSVRVPFSFQRV